MGYVTAQIHPRRENHSSESTLTHRENIVALRECKILLHIHIALHRAYFFFLKSILIASIRLLLLQYKFSVSTDCTSFSPDQRIPRNGKTYGQNSLVEMSVNAENTADAPAVRNSERAEETVDGVSPDWIEERTKANLEPLNEQITTLTHSTTEPSDPRKLGA